MAVCLSGPLRALWTVKLIMAIKLRKPVIQKKKNVPVQTHGHVSSVLIKKTLA
jgi:hypothetical protein